MAEVLIDYVREEHGDAVLESHSRLGNDTVVVDKDAVPDVIQFLKEDDRCKMNLLRQISCVDYDNRHPRFEVVYVLYSLQHKHMLLVRAPVPEDACEVPTISHLYRTAGWLEREVWDMYGVTFEGHPDLRRVMMYEEFEGHPLRKDYDKQKGQPRTEFIGRERDSVEEFNIYVKDRDAAGSRDE
jgi:NADH-quinone oxidoreductase subunit C